MKRLISAVILTVTVTTLAITSAFTVGSHYKKLTHNIETIENLYKNSESAEEQLIALKKSWEKAEPTLMFFANHDSVEEIGIQIDRLIVLSEAEDISLFFAEAAALKSRIKHLKDSESLTFESVF